MLKIQSFIFLSLTYITLFSCNQRGGQKLDIRKPDSLVLAIRFNPAFEENAEVTLMKADSFQIFKILIRNNSRVDKNEDTFWFKQKYLTAEEYLKLDSTLIEICKQKVPRKNYTAFDGMGISSVLIHNKDTNMINFHSPSKNFDSTGYNFSKSVFKTCIVTFQDTLINDYFDDLETYIDESQLQKTDAKRKIDQRRMEKYNWTIQRSN